MYPRDEVAYEEGRQARILAKGDVTRIRNPYPARTKRWFSWNMGWNSDIVEKRSA